MNIYKKLNFNLENKMPSLFIGHGSPLNAIENNNYTQFLKSFALKIPRPKLIFAISAHWETTGTKIQNIQKPKTIHDFGGFPDELYQIQYPVDGDIQFALEFASKFKSDEVLTDDSWGIDHGTWSILKDIYPNADIPVVQLSLNKNWNLSEHLHFAKKLSYLRSQGILILGSGNITHNLRKISWQTDAPTAEWAVEFDLMIKNALINHDEKALVANNNPLQTNWKIAHPSLDHYIPLLYAYGAAGDHPKIEFIYEEMQNSSLSMRSVLFY